MERFSHILLLSISMLLFNSCAAIEGIFKAGMWTGFLIVGVVIALVIWIIVKLVGGGRR
ncbi:hypothetical protein [Sphingobacterium chuzhouense]|uniref:Phosphatidate cytidylyltransferase n=1 Tax=Sphingobacterium chuzhouense TaxID=1742264 RepID=A0ABR7XXQ3_9SPHI|nr:hypothetical protein [Sphingobacterium chuzhouense]MBD1423816.1 hypothetical protein [Sphingobacterium chuzhouense]